MNNVKEKYMGPCSLVYVFCNFHCDPIYLTNLLKSGLK